MNKTIRRLAQSASIVAAAAMLLSGCSQVQNNSAMQKQVSSAASKDVFSTSANGQKIKDGGTLVVGISADPDKLDPTTSSSMYSRYVFQTTCEKLYDNNSKGNLVPLLADGNPQISSDGLTYSFNVKQGVKFSDGTPLNADAVVKTLQRDLTLPGSARKNELGPITNVSKTSEYGVQIKLSKPFAPLTAALADRAGMIMSPKTLDAEGTDFGNNPSCVGAYKLEQRVPSTSVTVVKDPNYYDAKDVHYDKIEYKIIKEQSIRAQNLKSGDVMVADALAPQDVQSLKSNGKLEVLSAPSLGFQGMQINIAGHGVGKPTAQIDTPIAKDKLVRQALSMSIDRKALVKNVFYGLYDPTGSFIANGDKFTSSESSSYPAYNPAKAKQLLAQAGVKTPYTINVEVANTASNLQMMQALQTQVKEGGFDMKIKPTEYTTLLSNLDKGTYDDAAQFGWSGRIDPDGNVSSFYKTGAAMNYPGYSNQTVDQALTEAAQTNDTKERATLYGKAIKQLNDDLPYIYIYRQRYLTGVSKSVANVDVYQDGVLRLAHAGALTK